jgi:hypothetical protein
MSTQTLVLKAGGFTLTVTGAPEQRNRNENGIRELLRRSRVTQNITCTWRQLREYALGELHLIIDPMDDPAPDDRTPGGGWDVERRWAAPNPYRTGAGG